MVADFDKSGTITGVEAFMLGLALSLDSFGAGIGAAMLGFSPLYLSLAVSILSSGLVFFGNEIRSCVIENIMAAKVNFCAWNCSHCDWNLENLV